MGRKAISFYHVTLCASHITIFISLQPVIRKHAFLDHISCIYTKGDFRSMSLGLRRLIPGGNLGYHEFIIGSDILLIKATFMGRMFVSHTQIYGVDLRIIKRKSAWQTYLHIYVQWGPPTLAS